MKEESVLIVGHGKRSPFTYDERALLPNANIDRWFLESEENKPATFPNKETKGLLFQFPLGVTTAASHSIQ